MTDINEYKKKFKRCILEYTTIGGNIEEDDPNAQLAMPADPNAMAAPADPNAMAAPAPTDPAAMGGAAPTDMNGDGMTDATNAMVAPAPVQPAEAPGFQPNPQPAQSEENMNEPEQPEEEEENDEIKNKQEKTEEKIDALSAKFEKVLTALDTIEKRIEDSDEEIDAFKAEMEKRNPTAVEKMTIRSQKSGPFVKTPEEYWQTDAPDNYSPEDDNNGVGEPQYEITKGDIDNITDWRSISKSFEDEREQMGLRNILGY